MAENQRPGQGAGKDNQTWVRKFQVAFRGLWVGVTQSSESASRNSFWVHGPASIIVLTLAFYRRLEWHWIAILFVCIALVWIAELFNTSIEKLACAITKDHHPQIKDALDIAGGAVLAASLFATVIGLIVFLVGSVH